MNPSPKGNEVQNNLMANKGSPQIPKHRPFTLIEAFQQILRRWYIVLFIGLTGSTVACLFKDRFQLSYLSQASFRVTAALRRPQIDTNVHIPQEDPLEPLELARNFLDEALTIQSLEHLFASKPKVFTTKSKKQHQELVQYIRKNTKIRPKTKWLYTVQAWGGPLNRPAPWRTGSPISPSRAT